jgi:quercetin dioxygenase-like cupin family protein
MMQRADNQPITIGITIYGGIYCKMYEIIDNGTIVPSHVHHHDHITLVMQGAVRVWCDDAPPRDYTAPATIHIAAGSKHLFATLESHTTLACLHAASTLDDGEPVVTAEHTLDLEG